MSTVVGAEAATAGRRTGWGHNSYTVGFVHVSPPAGAARRLPVTQRGRRARALIIDAAATLMYQKGVSMTSLDDVLAAAGSGKSQLYHYFDSKAELVAAVIERQLELVLATVQQSQFDGAFAIEFKLVFFRQIDRAEPTG